MSDTDKIKALLGVIIFLMGLIVGILWAYFYESSHPQLRQSEQWGGAVPMDIYTVYDRDTGVYYAVTEKGGICVMETMSGRTKLVDEGDGASLHPNKESKNVD